MSAPQKMPAQDSRMQTNVPQLNDGQSSAEKQSWNAGSIGSRINDIMVLILHPTTVEVHALLYCFRNCWDPSTA